MALMDVSTQDGWQLALAPFAGWPETAAQSRPAGALREITTRFLTWRARRETVRLLSAVDAATLRDLGIIDIESTVYGAPEGRKRRYDPDWWKRARRFQPGPRSVGCLTTEDGGEAWTVVIPVEPTGPRKARPDDRLREGRNP